MHFDFGYFEEKKLGKPYDVKLIKRLYPFSKPYRPLFIGSILLVIFITLFDLSLPYITKITIDRYIVPQTALATQKKSAAAENKIRYLRADINDPEIETIVYKYSDQFNIYGSYALIPLDDLSNINKKDLAVLRKNDLAGVSSMSAIFLTILIANFIFNYSQFMMMEYAGQKIMHDLRIRLFMHIQSLNLSFFTRNPVGRLVTRVTNDIQNMHDLFTSFIVFIFKDLFLLIGIAVVLLVVNWRMALVSFTVLPFVLYASIHFSGQVRNIFRVLRIKLAEINTRFAETIGGIKVVQLFFHEKENQRDFAKLNHEYFQAGMQQIHVFAVFMPVIELLSSIALAVIIYYGGGRVMTDNISLGALVAFISYTKMFFRPVRDIAEKYNIIQNAMASAERIFAILDSTEKNGAETSLYPVSGSETKTPASKNPVLNKIEEIMMKDVSFCYVADEPVLKEISFRVRTDETVALVGPTGSGKTSLISLITRFYDPTSGEISINGRNINEFSVSDLRSKTALVMQDPFLFSGTIRDNILQGNSSISEKEMEHILNASNCNTFVDRLQNGLDTVLSEGGGSISSGERQLISIARAFARNPDLIIFDEATSYIDSQTENEIQKALSNLMADRTSIIVAHRLSTVRNANRIMVLHRGRITESGTHAELMKRKGFYFKLNQFQL